MSDYEGKLKAKQVEIQSKVDSAVAEHNKLVDQRRELDRKLGLIREEIVRLQGAFREINNILGIEIEQKPTPEKKAPTTKIPKKRKDN